MAKQDDGGKKKPNLNRAPSVKSGLGRVIDYSTAEKVTEIPEGYTESVDPITGKTFYYKESETKPIKSSSTSRSSNLQPTQNKVVAPKINKPLKDKSELTIGRETKPSYKQHVVYKEGPIKEATSPAVNLDVAPRVEHKVNTGYSNPNLKLIEYPEAGTGGYSKSTQKMADAKTGIIQPQSVIDAYTKTGVYTPVTEGVDYRSWRPESAVSLAPGQEVNKSTTPNLLSNTKNPVAEIGTKQEMTAPLINKSEQGIGTGLQDIKTLPNTELKDKTKSPYYNQYQSEDKITSPKFKDGGYVPKSNLLRKNYLNGGDVTPEEKAQGTYIQNGVKYRKDGVPILTSSYDRGSATPEITSANTLPLSSGTEFTPSGNAATSGSATYEGGASADTTKEKKQGSGKGRAIANQAGQALGTYGTGYHASQVGTTGNKGSDIRSSALSAAGQSGAIGGAVSGIAAIGDQIGKPIREKSERTDKEGNLVDVNKAKRNAVLGTTFSPSQRLSYEGGLTDVSGKAYIKSIEDKAKKKISDETFSASMGSRNERMEAAEGGTIVGKGGPKDDAILSKINKDGIRSGSFIVPAENNGLAKKLREKFLGGNPEKKAQFKKGGEADSDVAVSNGEHLFTPKEKQKLTAYLGKEILEKLAPNAEENDEMNCGGKLANGGKLKAPMVKYATGTPPSGVKRVNSTGNPAADKLIDNAYINPPKDEKGWNELISKVNTLTRGTGAEFNKFRSWAEPKRESLSVKSEDEYKSNIDLVEKGPAIIKNIKKLKEIGASDDIIKRYTEQAKKYDGSSSTVKFSPDDLFDKYKTEVEDKDFKDNKESVKKGLDSKVQQAYKELQDANTNPDKYTAEEIAKKQEVFDNVAMYRDKLNKGIDDNDIKAFMEGKNILSKEGKTKYPDSANTTTTKTTLKAPEVPVTKAEAEEMARVKEQTTEAIKTGNVPTGIGPKKAPKVGSAMTAKKQAELMKDMGTVEPKQTPASALTNQIQTQEATLKTPTVNTKETITETPTKEGAKWYSGLGNGLEYGAAAAQVGMGLRGLNKSGKMPVDKIDPLFQSSVDKAQAAAKFGFTPEQQFSIDQDRQNAINAARFSARNFAGGNAGTAFTQERNAINQGWGMGLKAKIAGQELMQDKQRYADTLALQKAGMSRQLYEDKLAGWNQQQQAGSQLLGAGIRNMISANRYQKELEAQKQRQQYNG